MERSAPFHHKAEQVSALRGHRGRISPIGRRLALPSSVQHEFELLPVDLKAIHFVYTVAVRYEGRGASSRVENSLPRKAEAGILRVRT